MDIKAVVSKDVWDAIKDNYERGSYTTAISNLITPGKFPAACGEISKAIYLKESGGKENRDERIYSQIA